MKMNERRQRKQQEIYKPVCESVGAGHNLSVRYSEIRSHLEAEASDEQGKTPAFPASHMNGMRLVPKAHQR